MRLSTYGSSTHPLRPSSLGKLVACPMRHVLDGDGDEGNEGANVGTSVHKGVEAWHETLSSESALEAMRKALKTFPNMSKAGAARAEKYTAAYIADPRNAMKLECEIPVRLTLADDVVIAGTLDQIRDNRVWDLKTTKYIGSPAGRLEYQYQQAAYVLAARETLKKDVLPGGLIWCEAYNDRTPQPFVKMDVTIDDCWELMETVRRVVLAIRSGRIEARPSADNCKYCDQPKYPVCRRKGMSLV